MSIGRRYDTTIDALRAANRLEGSLIRLDALLSVPEDARRLTE